MPNCEERPLWDYMPSKPPLKLSSPNIVVLTLGTPTPKVTPPLNVGMPHMVISKTKRPQHRPQNTLVLTMGTPKRYLPILGNPPHIRLLKFYTRNLIMWPCLASTGSPFGAGNVKVLRRGLNEDQYSIGVSQN